MKNIKIYCSWDLEFDLYTERQIELWVDVNPIGPKPPNTTRVIFLLEPPEIRKAVGLNTNLDFYDFILTHDNDLIESMENAFLCEFGGCWVRDYEFAEKKFSISTLIGGKKFSHGHYVRQQLFDRSNEIKLPKVIWTSKNFPPANPERGDKILEGNKTLMFDSQFHICIENVKRENWFTEKLLDCLYTKTVPIYYGCPNIGNWFDERGFIIVDSVNDIIEKTNSITKETYQEMLPYIEENHKRSKIYSRVDENISRSIQKNILPLL